MKNEWKTIKIKEKTYERMCITKAAIIGRSHSCQVGFDDVISYLYDRLKQSRPIKRSK